MMLPIILFHVLRVAVASSVHVSGPWGYSSGLILLLTVPEEGLPNTPHICFSLQEPVVWVLSVLLWFWFELSLFVSHTTFRSTVHNCCHFSSLPSCFICLFFSLFLSGYLLCVVSPFCFPMVLFC